MTQLTTKRINFEIRTMDGTIYSVITGTGTYIPLKHVRNEDFLTNEFYDSNGRKLDKKNQDIIDGFAEITRIAERRHVTDDLVTSDIAYYAAIDAIKSANIDKEELDYIIVAHNFADVKNNNRRMDAVPGRCAVDPVRGAGARKPRARQPDDRLRDRLLVADDRGPQDPVRVQGEEPVGAGRREDRAALIEGRGAAAWGAPQAVRPAMRPPSRQPPRNVPSRPRLPFMPPPPKPADSPAA